jgi:TRAP-type C4-dicarboxylate transport system permease small subunit
MWDSFKKLLIKIEAGLNRLSQGMAVLAAIVLAGMMLLTVGDVVGRYFFNRPIKGTFELIGLLLVCAGTWGLAYCQIKKAHININILVERFPRKPQLAVISFAYFIGMVGFSLVSWQTFLLAVKYLTVEKGRVTDTLRVPYFPFILILTISTGVAAVILMIDLVRAISEAARK